MRILVDLQRNVFLVQDWASQRIVASAQTLRQLAERFPNVVDEFIAITNHARRANGQTRMFSLDSRVSEVLGEWTPTNKPMNGKDRAPLPD